MKILQALVMGFVLAVSGPVYAQKGDSPDDNNRLQTLIDELKGLIEKGEKDRLADPWYLRDLRDTIGRYDWPWRANLLSDDFSGRGPMPDAPWKVVTGEFLIDWRYGMRSVVKPTPKVQPKPQAQPRQPGKEDAARQLLGGILKQALGIKEEEPQRKEPVAPEAEIVEAKVIAPVRITNSFATEMEITSRPLDGTAKGGLEWGLYQGPKAVAGYWLAYLPDAAPGSPSLELIRRSSRGRSATLELYDKPLDLVDNAAHKLIWTRDEAGIMKIKVDGRQFIVVTDRSFRDPFSGVAIVNKGGDYAVRRIKIDGTK